ncbi:MAG: phosphodiester glycosidase family protein [Fimbriimonadaceae bacterium]|nr:phosphodiester glycosidase family protein [Fimbriimonadaceae bacterium]
MFALLVALLTDPPVAATPAFGNLDSGLTYRREVVGNATIHSVTIPRAAASRLIPVLAGRTMFAENRLQGRETISDVARDFDAVLATNGDFYYGGMPQGMMVTSQELVRRPARNRPAFAWGIAGGTIVEPEWRAALRLPNRRTIRVSGLNESCSSEMTAVNTPAAAIAYAAPPSVFITVRVNRSQFPVAGAVYGRVTCVESGRYWKPIPNGHFVITGRGTPSEPLAALEPGDEIALESRLDPAIPAGTRHVIGGGPVLVRDRRMAIDWSPERMPTAVPQEPIARTAIGAKEDGSLLLVVVESSGESKGIRLVDLAAYMIRQGCMEAMNLDGSGCSGLWLRDRMVTRPSDSGGERPVANALIWR